MLFRLLFLLSACGEKEVSFPQPDTEDTENTEETGDSEDTGDVEVEDPNLIDDDGDGFTEQDGDCDDTDSSIYPNAADEWYDGIDSDCAGNDDYDQDGDGYSAELHGGEDCDDEDADISPEASEVWYDGIDQNCDDLSDFDSDMDGQDDRAVDLSNSPRFLMQLHPIGTKNGNVIQGIAVDLENEEIWTSTDMYSSNDDVLINRLSLKTGTSQYCHEYTDSLELGHGQDLSLEKTSSGTTYLWTGDSSDRGIARVNPETMVVNELPNLLPTGWSHTTPTIGLNNQWIAVRGSKDGDSTNNDWIRIYDKTAIEQAFGTSSTPPPLYEFNIDAAQRVSDMWFQGIALDEELGLVYALTGNNSLSQTQKLLYVYDLNGNIVDQTTLSPDLNIASNVGSKFEPESLSLVKDESTGFRYLYFTMMFGASGANIKNLYSISPSSFSAGGQLSGNPIDWLLRYNSSDGEISFATIHPDGNIGCEVKRDYWTTGWTSFASYFSGGDPFLLIQKETEGDTKIHPLDWDADLSSATKDSDWSSGWDTFQTWEFLGNTYLFHYKSSTGLARVSELTTSGNTSCCSEDEDWDSGWDVHVFETTSGGAYLLRYSDSNSTMETINLGAGTFGATAASESWTANYEFLDSLTTNTYSLFFRLDDAGMLEVLPINTDGTLGSVTDSYSVGGGWDAMFTAELEGNIVIYLYDDIGIHHTYEITSSGQILGELDSGFEQAGWTGMLHFQTNTP